MTPDPHSGPHSQPCRRFVVSETSLPTKISLEEIRQQLKRIRATGKLVVNFSQGSANTVTFEARQSINGDDHVEIKFVPSPSPVPSPR